MKKHPAQPTSLIGILALQGSFTEHMTMLAKLDTPTKLIRSLNDIKGVTACIIPGGESTVMMQMLKSTGLDKWLITSAKAGMPIYGTCAGMIVLANLGLIDIQIDRNAYGPQLYSFEDKITWDKKTIPGIFIRAPKVLTIGPKVKVLAMHGHDPVLMQQRNVLAGSFHPELTGDNRIHQYFCRM